VHPHADRERAQDQQEQTGEGMKKAAEVKLCLNLLMLLHRWISRHSGATAGPLDPSPEERRYKRDADGMKRKFSFFFFSLCLYVIITAAALTSAATGFYVSGGIKTTFRRNVNTASASQQSAALLPV